MLDPELSMYNFMVIFEMTKQKFKNEIIGVNGGAWNEKTHMMLYPDNFNHDLANFIVHNVSPLSVLEFGSGLGHLSRYIVEHMQLNKVYCIEPVIKSDLYDEIRGPRLINIDIFTDTYPPEIQQDFDLVLSIEVAEHIDQNKHDELFDFLTSHSNNWLIFSGAHVDQGGHGHISERPESEWREEIVNRGMIYKDDVTKEIRQACDKKNINHRCNLMVFKKF